MKQLRLTHSPFSLLAVATALLSPACTSHTTAPTTPEVALAPHEERREHFPQRQENSAPKEVAVTQVMTSGAFLPPLPRAVTSFGAAATSSHVYVFGGYFGEPHSYSKEGQSADVLRLSLSGDEGWKKVSSLPHGLQGLAAVAHGERVCHFGGNRVMNVAGTKAQMVSLPLARCFDPQKETWTALPDLPEGRSSHGAALLGSTVYVMGGWILDGDASSGRFATVGYSLDLTSPAAKWESIATPFSRRAVGMTAVGKKLIVVGGMTADGQTSKEVDIYDPGTREWEKGPEHPGDAFGISVTSQNETVFASGREGIVRSFRPGESSWREVRKLAFSRFFHEMRAVGKELVVVGGISGMHTRGRTRIVERLSLEGGTTYGQLSFETPSRAKNRQGVLSSGHELYLFGGNLSLEQHDFERQHFTNEGWKLDLSTLTFTEAAPFPLRRQSMHSINTEVGGLALGGFGHEPLTGDDTEALSQEQVFAYSWEKDEWQEVGKMPRGRTQFGIGQREKDIWVFGGLNYDPTKKEAFDHERTIWTSHDAGRSFVELDVRLPGPRRAFAGAELDGKYFLIGGMKENFQLVDDCLEFEFETKEFSPIHCPEPRLSGDLIAARDRLYLVGGSVKTASGLEESRTIQVYDPKTRGWSTLDFQLPLSTRHLRALPFRDGILLLSTHNDQGMMTIGFVSP